MCNPIFSPCHISLRSSSKRGQDMTKMFPINRRNTNIFSFYWGTFDYLKINCSKFPNKKLLQLALAYKVQQPFPQFFIPLTFCKAIKLFLNNDVYKSTNVIWNGKDPKINGLWKFDPFSTIFKQLKQLIAFLFCFSTGFALTLFISVMSVLDISPFTQIQFTCLLDRLRKCIWW